MAYGCKLVNFRTGELLAEGFLRFSGKTLLINVPNLVMVADSLELHSVIGVVRNGSDLTEQVVVLSLNLQSNVLVVSLDPRVIAERRRGFRVPYQDSVFMEIGLGSALRSVKVDLVNISVGGCAFIYKGNLLSGDTISFPLQDSGKSIRLAGKIVWVSANDGFCLCGVQFIRPSTKALSFLTQLVSNASGIINH